MNEHMATVGKMYEAFGRGDVAGLLAHCAGEIQWEPWDDNEAQRAGVPWLQLRRGKDGVAEFFKLVGGFTWREFNVVAMMAGSDRVATEMMVAFELPDGTLVRDHMMHQFTFNAAGQVIRFRHYLDTAKHIAAAQQWQASQTAAATA